MFVKIRTLIAVLVVMVAVSGLLVVAQPAAAQGTSIELIGKIDAMSGTTLVVSAKMVDVSRAEVKGALRVGLMVKIEGTVLASGVIVAREVKLFRDTSRLGKIELAGMLTSLGGGAAVVNGVTVDVSTAQFYSGVIVGAVVKVEGRFNAAGVLVAREIKLATAARAVGVAGAGRSGDDGPGHDAGDDHGGRGRDDSGDDHSGGDDHGGKSGRG